MLGTLGNPDSVFVMKHEVFHGTEDLSDVGGDENEPNGYGTNKNAGVTPNQKIQMLNLLNQKDRLQNMADKNQGARE